MTKTIELKVTNFASTASIVKLINEAAAGKVVDSVFYNKDTAIKGTISLVVKDEEIVNVPTFENAKVVTRPAKIKEKVTSEYYCVYYDRGKWTYSFKYKGKRYKGKYYDTELQAVHEYDKKRWEIEGNVKKLNMPELFNEIISFEYLPSN